MGEGMISSESRMPEIGTSGLMSGGEETWPWLRLRHRHGAKAAGNSYSLKPTAGRASPRLYPRGSRVPNPWRWRSMAGPELGTIRTGADGRVFHVSRREPVRV